MEDKLIIANKEFNSRLIIGSGKYSSDETMKDVIKASGSEMMTVAVRRVDFESEKQDILSAVKQDSIFILPNTSGAQNADEAVRIAKIASSMGLSKWVKIEITPNLTHLLPDGTETLKATELLVKEGFVVLPYINADPVLAKKLEEAGAAAIMPLGSPIGSNRGLDTIEQVKIIIENSNLPVIIDAGIGCPSDATISMEIGADAIMTNTAIATADEPIKMASAFNYGVKAGRLGYLSGLASKNEGASPSSPIEWLIK